MIQSQGRDPQYLPRDAVRALQDAQLRRQIALCFRGHPYYQRVFREHGLTPDDFRTVDDLRKLPITDKLAFAHDPEAFRLTIPDLPPDECLVWDIVYTTGTTSGHPAPVYSTTYDHYAFLVQTRRSGELSGWRPDERIANVLPLPRFPMGAFIRVHYHAAAMGLAVADALPGTRHPVFPVHRSLDEAVDLVETHRATIVYGVAGYVRRLLIRARELGKDYSSVRIAAVTGEYCSPAMREDIKRRLIALGARDPVVNDRYGSTELGMLTQCAEGAPWHNPAPEFVYLEVVDESTGERLPDGERGLLVLTHLDRRGTVMLRYVMGDIVSLTHEPCAICGRTSERVVGPPVRTKELVKIRGMLINPDVVKEEVMRTTGVEEFQIVFTRADLADPLSMDDLVLRVAVAERLPADVESELVRRIIDAIAVRPTVRFEERSAIFDPERAVKPARVVDLRQGPSAAGDGAVQVGEATA